MTIDEFIDEIVPGGWYLDGSGNLTTEWEQDCPIWQVYREKFRDDEFEPTDFVEAGVRLGLSEADALAIARAADARGHLDIRSRLLKAAGLEG